VTDRRAPKTAPTLATNENKKNWKTSSERTQRVELDRETRDDDDDDDDDNYDDNANDDVTC